MSLRRVVALSAVLLVVSACGGGPTTPSASSLVPRLALTCDASTILAGDHIICRVTEASVNVSFTAVWTSSDPNVVTAGTIGIFTGKSEGQATLTATYE